MSDGDTTIADLRRLVADFVAERDWQQFHTPKNLSMALAGEAAELMEHFQWLERDEAADRLADPAFRQAVAEEVADVCAYLLSFANAASIDLSTALRDKMQKNAAKYPAPEYRGRHTRE